MKQSIDRVDVESFTSISVHYTGNYSSWKFASQPSRHACALLCVALLGEVFFFK